jgi:hypothetical protein
MPLETTPGISSRFNDRAGTGKDALWSMIAGDAARIAQARAIEARHVRLQGRLAQHHGKHRKAWVERETAKLLAVRTKPSPQLRPDGAATTKAETERQAAANVAARIKARIERLQRARDNMIKRDVLGIGRDGRLAPARRAANRGRAPAHPLKREIHVIVNRATAARKKAQDIVRKTYKARLERAQQRGAEYPAREIGKALARRIERIDTAQHRLTHQAFLRAGIDRATETPSRTRGGQDMAD